MNEIRVAVIGVGNCTSALVQGVHYYRNTKEEELVPGLLHVNFGGYHPKDIRFVAAFDINQEKVGKDLGDAIYAAPNNTPVFCKVPKLGVTVKRSPVLDGLGKFCRSIINVAPSQEVVDVAEELKRTKADLILNYVPVGSERAARFYANAAIEAGCAFINCMPSFIASTPFWQRKFKQADLPVAGDDVMSQIGATVLHKTLAKLFVDRGVKIDESYQLNVGGDTDFLNMLDEARLLTKRESKTSAVRAMIPYPVPLRIGPSDYVDFLKNIKVCYISMKGKYFGDTPVNIDLKLEVIDAPNSAGVIIDAIRATKIALDREISGPLISISAYAFKHPPVHAPYEIAKTWVRDFIEGKKDR